MSHYAKTLLPETQKRYNDKFKYLRFTNVEEEDPYLLDVSSKTSKFGASLLWTDDNTKWIVLSSVLIVFI